jgi:hypothetical protein
MRWCVGVSLTAVLLMLSSLRASAQQIEDAPTIRQTIEAALPASLSRELDERVPRATIDEAGDVTVVFALRSADEMDAVREAALEDSSAVLRAIYSSPEANRVTSATVIGTFSVIGKRGTAREQPVLRAVLSADRARALSWPSIQREQLPALVDTWWLMAAFGDIATLRGGTASAHAPQPVVEPLVESAPALPAQTVIRADAEGRPHEPLGAPQVHQQLDLALLHLNDALFALSGNDVRIARSQFKQFFEEWDRAEEEVSDWYPAQYEALDLEIERAEIALLHRQPEDMAGARVALLALRAGILDIARDLEAG